MQLIRERYKLPLPYGRGWAWIDGGRFRFVEKDKGNGAAEDQQQHGLEQEDAALEALLRAGIEQHLLQKLDAASDRSVLPRLQESRTIAADAVYGRHFIQSSDEGVDAGRAQSQAALSKIDFVIVSG